MAAAEARAAWQRTANRCLAQEDARRAPKLSSCSSSSKSQSEGELGDLVNVPGHTELGPAAHGSNPSMPDGIKWWLHIQPGFRHEKDFTNDQLNALEVEFENLNAESTNHSKLNCDGQSFEGHSTKADIKPGADFCMHQPLQASANCIKNGWDTRMPELKAVLHNTSRTLPKNKDMGELLYPDDNLMGLESLNSLGHKQHGKMYSDLETNLIGTEKGEPWWRTADGDELASLVAQKSLEYVENCDLPQPQIKHLRRGPPSCFGNFDHYGVLASSLDLKKEEGFLNLVDWENPRSDMNLSQRGLGDLGCSLDVPPKPQSLTSNSQYGTPDKYLAEAQKVRETDPNRAQLLEALCHSQTRARKAEEEAQKLQTEKEHIVKLFFKQASQLFAYKQWLQLLQLENLCHQLKNKEQPLSILFPALLPWAPNKVARPMKGPQNPAKRKAGIPRRHKVSKSVVALAVGLSLAGAGLLLGWTMGWLLPAF